jgi:hypothetical protein
MNKVSNYYLGLTGDKNIIYDPLCPKEKYSDLLQMFIDIHLELKLKYWEYNFLPEKLMLFPVYILQSGATNANRMLTTAVNC